MTKERIDKVLKEIQTGNNPVRILFAVENGSRAWRIESNDSDWDVRFVYVRKMEDYLKIDKTLDVITKQFEDVDVVGFDVYKYCGLLKASNPTAIEWLRSDILYYGEKPKELIEFADNYFNPKALFWHYKSMGKSNYLKYIKSKEGVTYKKYLYAMRGLINSRFVLKENKIPPIDFNITLEHMREDLPKHVYENLKKIIEFKKDSKEKQIVKNIVQVDNYIESELKKVEEPQSIKRTQLNDLFNNYILKELEK